MAPDEPSVRPLEEEVAFVHRLYREYGDYEWTAAEPFELSDDAKRVRRFFEDHFLERGTGPDIATLLDEIGLSQERTWDALHELERGVQVMFVPGTESFVKMPPFSYVPTRHRVELADGRRWYAGCAGEACAANGLFPGQEVTVRSTCPDCWEPITIRTMDQQLLSADPPDAVIHFGIHPREFGRNWIVTCDNINFFKSAEHVAEWEKAFPHKHGVTMPVAMGPQWVAGIAKARYWNYDRGPDVVSPGTDMVERFEAMGLDVGPWR
jgi:alkylmercury lyase-like protein